MPAAEATLRIAELREDPEQALLRASKLGPLVWVEAGEGRLLLVSSPDGARETLLDRAAELAKPASQTIPLGRRPPAEARDADATARLRRKLSAGMGADRAEETAGELAAQVEAAMSRWQDGATVELLPWLRPLVSRAVVRGAFASDLSDDELGQLTKVVRWAGETPRVSGGGPRRHGVVRPVMVGRLAVVARVVLANADLSRPSEMSAVADLPAREREALLGELLLGAIGPLVQESGWTLLRLGTEPEATAHLGTDGYAEAFVREVTRLHPTNPLLVRVASEETSVGGESVPAGSVVVVNVAALHRDPAVFPEAEHFRPERWLDGRSSEHRFSYAAFGIGERRCLGEAIATRSLTALLQAVGRDWDLSFAAVDIAAQGRRQLGDGVRATVSRRAA